MTAEKDGLSGAGIPTVACFRMMAICLGLLFGMALASASALPAEDSSQVQVDVEFSDFLNRYMASLDRIERIREERFRGSRTGGGVSRNARSIVSGRRLDGYDWAGESLIPELDNFSVEQLIRQMTLENLQLAVPDFDGTVHYRIDRIRVHGHSLAVLRGGGTYVSGLVTIREKDGHILLHKIMTANLVVNPTQSADEADGAFAFIQTDESDRVGPALAYFVEQALEAAWPDKAEEIRGPIIVQFVQPGERLLESMR